MLGDTLDNLRNAMIVINLCFFLIFITVKQKVLRAKKAVIAMENRMLELRRENEILDMELSYLTSPKRLENIYTSLNRNGEHIANVNEIIALNSLLPFYYGQCKKIQTKLP
ncbi:MAG: hypothetical protein LBP39_01175 [Rickettsiales bacterium]|nr:hypothetical protein [Rickettsiales bacterium]